MSMPPPLIPFDGDWAAYEERIYQAFLETFVKRDIRFLGTTVKARFRPDHRGKGYSFWHVISEAPHPRNRNEADRIPDFRRCERIEWISWTIGCASARLPEFSWWKNQRGRETGIVIWAEEHDFAVILAERREYLLLKTAYSGINSGRRRSFESERKAFRKAQNG